MMNQRIRELADQAHKQAVSEYYLRLETEHPGQVIFYDIFNETFAKFIIEECAELFNLTFTDEQYQRRVDKTIRKHFETYE